MFLKDEKKIVALLQILRKCLYYSTNTAIHHRRVLIVCTARPANEYPAKQGGDHEEPELARRWLDLHNWW